MKKVVVTGGSGGAGQYVVHHLLEHGYEVLNVDIVAPQEQLTPFRQVDLTDYGQTFAALYGYDAVAHMAANPEPDFDFFTGADRFKNNTLSTYNVFQTAVAQNMKRVVWASSETVFGFPFENVRPDHVPVTEADPVKPQNSYALSKYVCEQLVRQMNQLYSLPFIALRFSNILYTGNAHPANYESIPGYWADPFSRKFNLWGYIDARDVALSVRLSLEAEQITTAETFTIAAADTIMNRPNAELIEAVFPGVPIKAGTTDFETLLSINKARDMLGFKPQYSWRDILDVE